MMIILINIIISLGQIFLSYISNTSHSNNYILQTHGLRNNSQTNICQAVNVYNLVVAILTCCIFEVLAQSIVALLSIMMLAINR